MILFFLGVCCWNCDPASKYKRMERAALASGERHDSLFLGIYLGMPSKEFYTHCWEMNKKRLIKEGPSNASVEYFPPDFKQRTQMLFYPKFHNGAIYEVPVELMYEAWAPWNKNLHANELRKEVIQVFEKWYGRGFVKLEYPERGSVYAKVDGNRRISIWTTANDIQKVKVLFTDLTVEKALKKQSEKVSD